MHVKYKGKFDLQQDYDTMFFVDDTNERHNLDDFVVCSGQGKPNFDAWNSTSYFDAYAIKLLCDNTVKLFYCHW